MVPGHKQMNMVGHQYVGMQAATGLVYRVIQKLQVGHVIEIVKKACALVVSSLDNMLWDTGNIDAQTTGQRTLLRGWVRQRL